MKLPKNKTRKNSKFELVNDYHSKLDAQKELKRLRNENALFGKRAYFVFSSTNSQITFNYGVYEQVF